MFPMHAAQAVPDATGFFTFFICVISGFRHKADDRSAFFWDVMQRIVALPQYTAQFLRTAQIFTFLISFSRYPQLPFC
jgi:hypothetical protein